eukprot:scaffold75562_cov33-Tisochrysis_lutea.AAC.1
MLRRGSAAVAVHCALEHWVAARGERGGLVEEAIKVFGELGDLIVPQPRPHSARRRRSLPRLAEIDRLRPWRAWLLQCATQLGWAPGASAA